MSGKLLLQFLLLSTALATAPAQDFLLGVDYSKTVPANVLPIITRVALATDAQGAVYLLTPGYPTSLVVKLNASGDRVAYQLVLPFEPNYLAVSPAGNIYVAGILNGGNVVEKWSADGQTMIYRAFVGDVFLDGEISGLAVDSSGRAYAAVGEGSRCCGNSALTGFVVRLTPEGFLDYSHPLPGLPASIAVDASGSAFVSGEAGPSFTPTPGAYSAGGDLFLERISPDGSGAVYDAFVGSGSEPFVAVDAGGNAVISVASGSGATITRLNPQGTAAIFTRFLSGQFVFEGAQASDAAGNLYVVSRWAANYPAKNSVAVCEPNGSSTLTVLDPDGNILQATYLPGSWFSDLVLAAGPISTLYVAQPDLHDAASPAAVSLMQLSPHRDAQVYPLACLGNAANYVSAGIAGGEIISLYGQGLGPLSGTQPEPGAARIPAQLAAVEVTFNGTPGPLLYVQDNQVNAIAPWSLTPGQTVDVCVIYKGVKSNCIARPVVAAQPGVFSADGVFAVAMNQDWTVNSAANPAKAGEYVTVFATGLGPITPPQADGSSIQFPLPSNVLPVAMQEANLNPINPGATIPPTPITVQYAGPAPYRVAGVSQINFIAVAQGLPITLEVGAASCHFQIYEKPAQP